MVAFVPDPTWPSILELAIMLWGPVTGRHANGNELRFGERESKSIMLRELVWRDHEAGEGGGYKEIHERAIGPLPQRGNGQDHSQNGADRGGPKPWLDIGTIYRYLDADGHLVLEVIRTRSGRPRFRQRQPDGFRQNGEIKWAWRTRDIPAGDRPLYRLPEVLASAESDIVYVCEGEKDVDTLVSRGLIATTNVGGAGKWHPAYAAALRGRNAVLLPDNDEPGRKHAADVAASLGAVAATVRVLALPDLEPKGDVSDWLANGGTVEELERLARDTPLWLPPVGDADVTVDDDDSLGDGPPWEDEEEPPPPPTVPGAPPRRTPSGKPIVRCQPGHLPRMLREAQEALVASGAALYQRGMLVQPTEQQYTAADGSITHSAALVPVTAPALLKLMADAADWQKFDRRASGGGQWVECDPPDKLVQILLHNRGDWPFPVVRGVLTCPTLRPDGSLLTTPGYDPISRYFLMFPDGLELPADFTETPTPGHAQDSLQRLNELLDSYPFVNKASRSVALGMLMTQPLRCAMPVSPLLAVSAKAPGTGKSHLVDLCSTVAIGRPAPAMGASTRVEETEKGINTMLISGVPGFSIDNVSSDIDTPILNMATERPLISIRLFGVLESVEVENAVTIYMTGNNLAIIDEQGRRTMRCDLDAGRANPERRDFASDPIRAVAANRGRYIADVLTIARAYHLSGHKAAVFPIGSYAAWSHFVREPLVWLGETDPAETMNETARDDPATIRLTAILDGWYDSFFCAPKTLAEAVRDSLDPFRDTLKEHFPSRGGIDVDTTRMGNWLRKFAGRVVNGKRFAKDPDVSHSAVRWKIELLP